MKDIDRIIEELSRGGYDLEGFFRFVKSILESQEFEEAITFLKLHGPAILGSIYKKTKAKLANLIK